MARKVRRPADKGVVSGESEAEGAFDDSKDHDGRGVLGPGRIPDVQDGYVQ